MPKELKGLPYRISFKVLQIYGKFLSALPLRKIVKKSGKFLASHIGDFVFEHHCADVPRLVEPRLSLSHFAEAMFMPVYGVEDFEVTAVAVAVSVAYFEYLEFLLRLLVVDD